MNPEDKTAAFTAIIDLLVAIGEDPREVNKVEYAAPHELTITHTRKDGVKTVVEYEIITPTSWRRDLIDGRFPIEVSA